MKEYMPATTIIENFPELTTVQHEQFAALASLYEEWNNRINVISRKDMEHFYERHVLHSLAIAKFINFTSGTHILDVGTGGGFPGIPLAILFPGCDFKLVDSIGKKIKVVQAVAGSLGLKNVTALQERAENISDKFDFVVSRAVTDLPAFTNWIWNKFLPDGKNELPNGIIYLKGGNLSEELAATQKKFNIPAGNILECPINHWFANEFFETKKVVYVRRF